MDNDHLIVTTETMARVKERYLKESGLEAYGLMEISAMGCVHHLLTGFGPFNEDHVVVCVGPTDNGGVGLAMAFYLAKYAKKITVHAPVATNDPLAIQNKKRLELFYPDIKITADPVPGNLYIDALLDSWSQNQTMDDSIKETIEFLNHQANPLISIDIPSGVNADTGEALTAVKADVTLAIGFLRPAHRERHQKHKSHVALIDIGIPNEWAAAIAPAKA